MGRSVLILLDTHAVVWLASDDPRLSRAAKAPIDEHRQAERGLAISDFTLYELSGLFRKRQIGFLIGVEDFLLHVEQRFVILPITGRICIRALSLPEAYPKNPGDRIIGATALVEGLHLITADKQIRNSHAVPIVW